MNMTNNGTQTRDGRAAAAYRPQLAIYHPNSSGTGCALKLEMHPARGDEDGYFMMTMASQQSVGDRRAAVKTYSKFNWEKCIVVKLDFSDICRIMQVFRGECESIEDGKGLYHISGNHHTKIVLRHILSPVSAYSLEVYRNWSDRSEEDRASHIVLTTAEAYGLSIAFENSIGYICFGVPRVKGENNGFAA